MSFAPTPEMEIKILDERLRAWGAPQRQSDLAAGLDLHACLDAPLVLPAGAAPALIPSGLAVSMGAGDMAGLVLPRSGLGHKRGLVLGNAVGLIDADYTAEILISAWNRNPTGSAPIEIAPGDRIAQLVFVSVLRPQFREVAAFSGESERGGGGFGSTGTGAGPSRSD